MRDLVMNVAAMRRLTATLRERAVRVNAIANQFTARLDTAVTWEGPDARNFRSEWHGHYRGELLSLASRLIRSADQLDREIADQIRTSGG